MMKNIKVLACDNPHCDVSSPLNPDVPDEKPEGIYIDKGMVREEGRGGPFTRVYACSSNCIGPAVTAVFEDAYETGDVRKKW